MPLFYDKDDLDAQPRGCSCFDRDGEQMRDLVMDRLTVFGFSVILGSSIENNAMNQVLLVLQGRSIFKNP